ncbi:hypothetical protein [Longispora urticae]
MAEQVTETRLVLVTDPELGVGPEALLAELTADGEAAAWGPAALESPRSVGFPIGPMEVVVIPLAVNLVSSVLYDVLRRLVTRARRDQPVLDLEVTEVTTAAGDRVVVTRLRNYRP